MEARPNFYAIIPANVRYDKDLTPNAKLLYGEITALCNDKGYCWANNKYFSELYGVSVTSISKWISQLVEKGYLKSVIKYKEGSKEILNRYLSLVNYPIEEKLNTPLTFVNHPIEEKLTDNNTSSNNTFNNKNNNTPKYDFKCALLENGFELELVNEWLEIRKSKKGRNSKFALEGFLREVNLSKLDKNQVLRMCVERSWVSFSASWVNKQPQQQTQPHKPKIAL